LACDRSWHLNSWDNFSIPKFRARIFIRYGPPILIERESTEAELATHTEELRTRLLAAEETATECLAR